MSNTRKTKARKPSVITADQARDLLHYDPETGVLTWKARPGDDRANFNGRFAGKQAGSINPFGYRVIKVMGRTYMGHVLAWAIMTGDWPSGEVDHIDHSPDNNQWGNLRDVSRIENGRNLTLKRTSTTGVCGVTLRANGRFCARIQGKPGRNGKRIHLGHFDTFEEAVAVRQQAEIDHGYHANHGRAAT